MMFYDFFSKKRRSRLGDLMVDSTLKKIVRIIRPILGNGKKVLEIGPGSGAFLKAMTQQGYSYTAIEANKNLAEHCKKINRNAVIINASVPPIRLKKRSYDMVYLSGVIEHFTDHRELLAVFEDSHRVLKEKGLLVLVFPDCLVWKNTFYDIDYSHGYFTTLNRIRYMLDDTGFKMIKSVAFDGPFIGIPRVLLKPVLKTITYAFHLLYRISRKEIFLKGKIAFLTNILVIAQKQQVG